VVVVPILCRFSSAARRPPVPTLFPYTTLFRSVRHRERVVSGVLGGPGEGHVELRVRHGIGKGETHALLPGVGGVCTRVVLLSRQDRKSTRLNSSHVSISYAVFCLQKTTQTLTE